MGLVHYGIIRTDLVGAGSVSLKKAKAQYDREGDENQHQAANQRRSIDLVARAAPRLSLAEMRFPAIVFFMHVILYEGGSVRQARMFPEKR